MKTLENCFCRMFAFSLSLCLILNLSSGDYTIKFQEIAFKLFTKQSVGGKSQEEKVNNKGACPYSSDNAKLQFDVIGGWVDKF